MKLFPPHFTRHTVVFMTHKSIFESFIARLFLWTLSKPLR
jgi:hypothetical protein